MEDLNILSFDDALNLDEKSESNDLKKFEKQDQLEVKATDLKRDIKKKMLIFKKSLTNPQIDSVDILMDVETSKKELELTEKVLKALFPEEA